MPDLTSVPGNEEPDAVWEEGPFALAWIPQEIMQRFAALAAHGVAVDAGAVLMDALLTCIAPPGSEERTILQAAFAVRLETIARSMEEQLPRAKLLHGVPGSIQDLPTNGHGPR